MAAGNCSLTFTSAGARSLTATYAGDTNFDGSASAAEPHQVDKAATTTAITSDAPDPSVVGQSISVNFAVTVNAPGVGTPTGNVTVSDGTVSCTASVAVGQCSLVFGTARCQVADSDLQRRSELQRLDVGGRGAPGGSGSNHDDNHV